MSNLFRKIGVVLTSLPGYLAAVIVVLTVVSAELVPLLPGPWAVRLGGWIATALVMLRAAAEVVARVTPVKPSERGVLPS
jgi:hypothetical protein